MPTWITKNYPPRDTRLKAANRLSLGFLAVLLLCLPGSLLLAGGSGPEPPVAAAQQIALRPYTATYTTTINGINAELEHSLRAIDADSWQVRNFASILFVDIEEKARFTLTGNQLIPHSYHYANKLSKKRSSALLFDPHNNTVRDSLHGNKPLALPDNSFDKLSYQTQLRLELLRNKGQFNSRTYHLVDRTKYKTYQIESLGSERIETPAGTFDALKLKQQRPGKDKYTLIWLAPEWDYFVLRLQRMEDGEADYQINVKHAEINGKTLRGL